MDTTIFIPSKCIALNDIDIMQTIICKLCDGLILQPILSCSGCNYYACSICIKKFQLKKTNKCPLKCKPNIQFIQKQIPLIQNVLSMVKINCPNYLNESEADKCKQMFPYSQIIPHIKSCPLTIKPCINIGCMERNFVGDWAQHNLSCPYLSIECKYCSNMQIQKDLFQHLNNCEQRLIKCTNQNCEQVIQFRFLEDHLLECGATSIYCQYCDTTLKRISLEDHLLQCLFFPIACRGCETQISRQDLEQHDYVCPKVLVQCTICNMMMTQWNLSANHSKLQCVEFLKSKIEQNEKINDFLEQNIINFKKDLLCLRSELEYLNKNFYKIKQRLRQKDELIEACRIEYQKFKIDKEEEEIWDFDKKADFLSAELGAKKEWCLIIICENPYYSFQQLLEVIVEKSVIIELKN